MYQPLSLYIGLRYTRAKRRNQFISFVSLISLLGMVLGVAALVVVLSVMNGFESELRDRILAVVPHGFLDGPDNQLADWQQTVEGLLATGISVKAAPYVDGKIMLSRPGVIRGAQLNAIDPAYEEQVSIINSSMQQGSLSDLTAGDYNIIIGNILARVMGVYIGDEITVVLPRVTVTPFGLFPRVKRFTVSGIFAVGAELDSTAVFIHLQDGQKLFQMGSAVKGLRVEFDNIFSSEQYLPDLLSLMPEGSSAKSWEQTQGSLFQAVAMEKTMISLLLFIIVAIAAFNIVSILTMMVADKRSDIAVLRTMGASPSAIMTIFMIQGISVGVLGIGAGLLIGIPVAMHVGDIVIWFEAIMGAQVFNPEVYFISRIPSVLESTDIYLIVVVGLVLSALATIYPSYRAAKVQPAEALRYE
jgi:lipoprotein-releasing system permease protein